MENRKLRDLDPYILPGDHIHYFDLHGVKKGYGVLVKILINKDFPLTRRKLLLKNIDSGRYWTINEMRHIVKYCEHRSPNNTIKAFKIILKDSL
jgi:hypothetical protein